MRTLLALLLFVPVIASADEPDPKITEYYFAWNLASVGETSLAVIKTQDLTAVLLSQESTSIRMTPADAAAVGGVLARADDTYKQFAGKPGQSKQIEAGDWRVTFGTSRDGAPYATILRHGAIARAAVLNRKELAAVTPWMLRAVRLAEIADRRINP